MTRRYLIDADAFLHLRKLGLLERYFAVPCATPLWLAGRVADHELASIAPFIEALKRDGRIEVQEIIAAGDARQRFLALRKNNVDRGEAEAIAWAMGLAPRDRPLFISSDKKARQWATQSGVPAGDVLDVVVTWIEAGILTQEAAAEALAVWDDKSQQLGRPRDYTTFEETYQRRRQAAPARDLP